MRFANILGEVFNSLSGWHQVVKVLPVSFCFFDPIRRQTYASVSLVDQIVDTSFPMISLPCLGNLTTSR